MLKLQHDLNSKRIGTVLDTCHAIISIQVTDRWRKEGFCEVLSLHKYLEANADCMNIVHLSNAKGYGFGIDHGVNFKSQEDIEVFEEIMKILKDRNYQGLLTLELQEVDYADVKEFPVLKKMVEDELRKS